MTVYAFGEYELDTDLYELRREGEPCRIEPQVFDVLAYLVQHRDRVVTKQELLDHIWSHAFVTEATLSSRLKAARKAVGDSGREQRLIKTLHGRGCRFIAAVEERTHSAPDDASEEVPQTAAASIARDRSNLLSPPTIPSSTGARFLQDGSRPGEDTGASASPVQGSFRAVGREAELQWLHNRLSTALGGTRQLMFVTGEAGLGKTTVVEGFLEEVKRREAPWWTGHGQCLEHRGAGEAYMPVLEALGRRCQEPGGQDLIDLLARRAPTWLAQMPWLVSAEEYEALQHRILGTTRERMLREMVETVEALTAERPLILVLEDLHWSDYSTVDLLSWLAQRSEPARLLVIGTYRPADVKASRHPLLAVTQQLRIRGQCAELALSYLAESEVDEYLAARFPGADFPTGMARLIHQRTDGNPLFMDKIVDSWVMQGSFAEVEGQWSLIAELEELAGEVPVNLQELIEQQLEHLSPEDQRILEAASVAGAEFSAAAVAVGAEHTEEEAEERCAVLARQERFLRSLGVAEWPDGTVAARYGFIHDLYQEVLYDRVPAGRRARLHRQIGARLETGYGLDASESAVELALHFVRGRDALRAVRYLQFAAERALQRSAHREAIEHLSTGLELLQSLPDIPERAQYELTFQTLLAPALIATRGWAAPKVEHSLVRARELCQQLEASPQLSRVLYGLATLHEYRGEYQKSQALLEENLRQDDAGLLLESYELLACSMFHQGRFAQSLEQADYGLTLYDPRQHSELLARYGENPGVSYHDWAALDLWFLGFPEQALKRTRDALSLAQEHSYYSLTTAQAQAAFLHQHRREEDLTREWAEATIELATEQGFSFRVTQATILRGWALAIQGHGEEGLAQLREGLAAYQVTGAEMDRPYYLALLAEAYGIMGQPEEGLASLTEALEMVRSDRSFFYEAELYRLYGSLLLQTDNRNIDEAEASFWRAFDVARRQKARSLELRAAIALCSVGREQSRKADGCKMLAEVYNWFTEGLGTPNLQRARDLLHELEDDEQTKKPEES